MKSLITRTQTSLLAGLIVGSMVCTAAVSFAAEGVWIRKADMPTTRFGISIAEIDGKLFVIGGSQSNARLATVEVYDPATDSWTPKADMPTARKNSAAAVVNGIIYVFGGTQIAIRRHDHDNGSVRPGDRYLDNEERHADREGWAAAVPFNGKIYVIGGYGVNNAYESAVEVYDPVTDTWEDKAPLPVASGDFGFAGFNGKIYVFGGATTETVVRNTREYDPVTDSWTTKTAMPIARFLPSATVLDGKIYVLGGNVLGGNDTVPPTARVDLYDPVTDTWEAGVRMPTARGDLASATVKGKIYAIGGHTGVTWDRSGNDLCHR